MSALNYVCSLFNRCRKNRRRTSTVTAAMVLESRVLLAATSVTPLGEVSLSSSSDLQTFPLSDYFDDPGIGGSTVEIGTPLGSFFVETFDSITPIAAAKFLSLINGGKYTDMFFHRSSTGFVVQGGGYTYPMGATQPTSVVNNGSIANDSTTGSMQILAD